MASRVPVYGTTDAGRGLWLRLKNTCKTVRIFPESTSADSVHASKRGIKNHCRDVVHCGRLAVWLRQFLVGKEDHGTCRFCVSILSCTQTRFHDHDHEHDHHTTIRLQPTRKGWRFVVTSPWMRLHPRGFRQGHPRYTGPLRRKAVGGPNNHCVDDTTSDDSTTQALSRLSLRNKNSSHCHLEIIHGGGAGSSRTADSQRRYGILADVRQ